MRTLANVDAEENERKLKEEMKRAGGGGEEAPLIPTSLFGMKLEMKRKNPDGIIGNLENIFSELKWKYEMEIMPLNEGDISSHLDDSIINLKKEGGDEKEAQLAKEEKQEKLINLSEKDEKIISAIFRKKLTREEEDEGRSVGCASTPGDERAGAAPGRDRRQQTRPPRRQSRVHFKKRADG